jgi:hypothetical protein
MTGMTANSQTTGSDMEWQEFYLLNANGTFKNSMLMTWNNWINSSLCLI